MQNAVEKANQFLREEKAFRLGTLVTESAHPLTQCLSQAAQKDLAEGIRILQSVDQDILPVAKEVLKSDVFCEVKNLFLNAIHNQKRIFFTGCGATGRLSILLEACWRRFWREIKQKHPYISNKIPDLTELTVSVMAGGDFALIKAVEGFEDFPEFGKYQLRQAGVQADDVVIAITEGGETPFVIGTAWEGLATGAKVVFVYNNPTQVLKENVERSREVIENSNILKLDISTGPMAVAGSTRMQATTIELLVVGAALEMALVEYLQKVLSGKEFLEAGVISYSGEEYAGLFEKLLTELGTPSSISQLAALTQLEEDIYRRKSLVTYLTDTYLLDVLTDTTERSPTFMIPAFRKVDDSRSPCPWAFVKNPFYPTKEAWFQMLLRTPRGIDWNPKVYEELNAPPAIRTNPPTLDNSQIYKFQIGNEPDASRINTADSVLIRIAVEEELSLLDNVTTEQYYGSFRRQATLYIGSEAFSVSQEHFYQIDCDLAHSPFELFSHLAIKLILNTVSTATMASMGRIIGNAMAWVSPSNKKLIDRGTRLIMQMTGANYEESCLELHQAIEEIQNRSAQFEEVPSPVALAIERIGQKR
ncbi:MAG: hypothetical protein JXD22_13525 [Sedimentisphaerales bacterium]|nr:hypothetical protein [Sedimentisphaerales bacterium]